MKNKLVLNDVDYHILTQEESQEYDELKYNEYLRCVAIKCKKGEYAHKVISFEDFKKELGRQICMNFI